MKRKQRENKEFPFVPVFILGAILLSFVLLQLVRGCEQPPVTPTGTPVVVTVTVAPPPTSTPTPVPPGPLNTPTPTATILATVYTPPTRPATATRDPGRTPAPGSEAGCWLEAWESFGFYPCTGNNWAGPPEEHWPRRHR